MENQNPKNANDANGELSILSPTATAPAPLPPPSGQSSGLMGKLAQFYRDNKLYVWASLAGIFILSILGYFAFRPGQSEVKPAKVEVVVDAPATAPSGGEQVYKVKIANQDSTKLVDVELEVAYPEGVSYVGSTPKATSLSGTTFPVPDLSPGDNVAVLVKTKVQGEINEEKKVLFRLRYKFSNFNSEFISENTHTVRLVASDIALELSGPESTNNAQVVSYILKYKNDSDETIENARIELEYPDKFKFGESDPQPSLSDNVWNIGDLASGQTGTITFKGSFLSANTGQSQTFTASFLVLDEQGRFFAQGNTTFTTSIGSLPLSVTQEVTSGAADGIVEPGATLTYKLNYRNNTAVPVRGVQISLALDSNAIDFGSIRAEGAQVNNDTITWNASSQQSLETLNPNESGNLTFSVQINNPPVRDTSTKLEVKSTVRIKSAESSDYFAGNDLALKVSTLASVETSVEWVSGALPPRVGEATTYRLNIALRNGTNELRDGILTAFIPVSSGGVDISSVQPAKEASLVTFDQSTGKLTWKVGILSTHIGDFAPLRKMSILVRLIPSAAQAGQSPDLLKSVVFTATDSFTLEALRLTGSALTTANISDGGYSNGTVQRQY